MQTPKLDLALLDTHNLTNICVLDTSVYPSGFNKVNPSLEITAPGFSSVTLDFTPGSIQIYKSSNLGVVCEWCDEIELPDGIWKFKYTMYPATTYFIEKNMVRVDRLQQKFDEVYINLDITECDEKVKKADKDVLSIVDTYIQAAIAAGNKCIEKRFHTYYNKAYEILNKYINSKTCKL